MELKDLVTLPEQLQVVFVSGYLGYSLAYAGYRDNERKEDLLYGVLSFGIFGFIFYDYFRKYFSSFLIPGLGALLVSILVAIFWRKYGKKLFCKALHRAAISNEDGIRTVWSRITQDTTIAPTQIVVHLKDGSKCECDDIDRFHDASIPSLYTDSEGSIALYVTKKTLPNGEVIEYSQIRSGWGDRITYIPKDQISSVAIRYLKR